MKFLKKWLFSNKNNSKNKIFVPQSWFDVTWAQYLALQNVEPIDYPCVLCGVAKNAHEGVKLGYINAMEFLGEPLIEFVKDIPDLTEFRHGETLYKMQSPINSQFVRWIRTVDNNLTDLNKTAQLIATWFDYEGEGEGGISFSDRRVKEKAKLFGDAPFPILMGARAELLSWFEYVFKERKLLFDKTKQFRHKNEDQAWRDWLGDRYGYKLHVPFLAEKMRIPYHDVFEQPIMECLEILEINKMITYICDLEHQNIEILNSIKK